MEIKREKAESRCTAREGATTAQTETNWAGQGGGGRVREGATTAQTETNWAGREEEAESRCTAREGATTAQMETNWAGQGGGGGRVLVYSQGGSPSE